MGASNRYQGLGPSSTKPFLPVQVTAEECGGVFERMFRRFIRRSKESGVQAEVRARRAFVKSSQARRLAKKRATARPL